MMKVMSKRFASSSNAFALEGMEQRTLMSAPALLATGHPAPEHDRAVYAPHSKVEGKTIGQWTALWWKWAVSFSLPNDPFTDTTGANANLKQKGPVFFLAGNPTGPSERSFTIPGNKAILVPLLSAEWSQVELGFDKTPAQIRQAAKEQGDLIDSLHLSIDGVPVQDLFSYREASPDFHFNAAANNLIGVPAGDSGVAVADGYFVMLKPLGPGQHTITFGGGISSFGFSIADTDHVAVSCGHGGGGSDGGHDCDDDGNVWDD